MRDFNHTVDLLVRAYLNDELQHEDYKACVVGNICGGETVWKMLFMTTEGRQISYLANLPDEWRSSVFKQYDVNSEEELIEKAMAACNNTGYSVDELKIIEYTFETCDRGNSEDEWMFNGLMAVVDVLADIHGIDLTAKEEAKKLFVKV